MARTLRTAAALLALALPLVVGGCSGEERAGPRSHLQLDPGLRRLLVQRDQRTEEARYRVVLPRGTKELLLRARCTGAGKGQDLGVADSGFATDGFGCDRASGAGGLVGLGDGLRQLAPGGVRTITVTAPPGATWSVVVDSR